MKLLILRRTLLSTIAVALAAPAAAAAAGPVGMVEEIPMHANVGGIAAGPEGNLWFTLNTPFGKNTRNAAGRITPDGRVTMFRKGLTAGVEPSEIVAGADGNLWFTFDGGITAAGGGGVARITPRGKIAEFFEPPELHGVPFELVLGPDGNIWFDHAAILTPTGQAIGRITPNGEIAEFSAGLAETAAVTHPVAGPDGNVWFADNSDHPAIGRITPGGEITSFPLPPREFPILEGPSPGPDGRLWFSVNEPTPAVERISSGGSIERFTSGLGGRVEDVGPFVAGPDGKVWFGIDKRPPHSSPDTERGLTGIGRITVGGRITEFSHCLRPMPWYSAPDSLITGPDGNVWFATQPSGEDSNPMRSSIPSIGRVTPAGRITEFRLGLHERSEPEALTASGGSIWFIDRETDSIGRIRPPHRPPNTFLVLSARRLGGRIRVRVAVPGPGRLRLRLPGGGAVEHRAPDCGTTTIAVPHRAAATAGGPRRDSLTFTPRGGSSYTRSIALP
jgi:virginiamycin B lyase